VPQCQNLPYTTVYLGPHEYLPCYRELRSRLAATKTNSATLNSTSMARKYVAIGKLIPMPVARATYATTQAGHLGSSARVALGTIQPANSPPRRSRHASRRGLSPARILISQQWRAFTPEPSPLGNMNRRSEGAHRTRRGGATRLPSRCGP
jgi:hypothetical protein